MDIFDFTQEGALNVTEEHVSNNHRFNPKPQGGKDYTVTIRLLPFMKDPKNSIVESNYHWLTDANGGFRAFSPARPNQQCMVSQRFFALRDANDDRQNNLYLQRNYGCIIQVKSDLVNPDNNGKFFTYRLPVKVFQMVEAAMKPSEDQLKLGKKPKDLLNPFSGYDIILVVKQTKEGRNYDSSEIADDKTSILLDGQAVERNAETEKTVIAKLTELAEEFDIVDEFGWKQASPEDLIRIKSILINQFGADPNFWPDVELAAAPAAPMAHPATAAPSAPASPATPVTSATPAQAPAQAEVPSDAQEAKQETTSDVDDIVKAAMQ